MSTRTPRFAIPRDRHVIIVDDDEAQRIVLLYVLGKSQIVNEVLPFSSGESLLTYFESVEDGNADLPGAIFLDVNMTGTTGFDVLAALRGNPRFAESPIIIMMTSSDADEDRQRAEELGADGFLPKQSGIAAFVNMIDECFMNEAS